MAKKSAFDPNFRGCDVCPLNINRTANFEGQVRPYLPNIGAGGLLFVGEAPGEDEVAQGVPFIGKAGQTLRLAMRAVGIDPLQVSIANAAKCRPTLGKANRAPTDQEVYCCSKYLEETISKCQPKVIVALGNTPCMALLNRDGIAKMRGTIFRYRNKSIFVVPTWHPSYVMRVRNFDPTVIDQFISDLQLAQELLTKPVPKNPKVFVARSEHEALTLLGWVKGETAIDVEGEGAKILSIAMTFDDDYKALVVPRRLITAKVYAKFQQILADSKIAKVGQNFNGYDRGMLEGVFVCDVENYAWDTMYGSYLWDERRGIHDLDMVAARFAKMGGYDYEFVEYRRKLQGYKRESNAMYSEFMSHLSSVPEDLLCKYNGLDACVTHIAADQQRTHLTEDQQRLGRLYAFVSRAYEAMEKNGIGFDMPYSKKLSKDLEKRIRHLERRVRLAVGDPSINVNSGPQMGAALFDRLKLHKKLPREGIQEIGNMKTPTGRWSVSDPVITILNKYVKNPVLEAFSDFKDLSKDKGTFVDGIWEIVGADDRARAPLFLHGTDCVSADTLIWTSEGLAFADVLCDHKEGFVSRRIGILSPDGPRNTSYTYVARRRTTLNLTFGCGLHLCCTPEHPLLTETGWKEAADLTSADYIQTGFGANFFPSVSTCSSEEAELLGMFLSDGHITNRENSGHYSLSISNRDIYVLKRVNAISQVLYARETSWDASNGSVHITGKDVTAKWLMDFPLNGAAEKHVPAWILGGDKSAMCAFVRGVSLDSSWCVVRNGKCLQYLIRFRSLDKFRLEIVQQVLWNLGVRCHFKRTEYKHPVRRTGNATAPYYYSLDVTGHSILRYLSEVGCLSQKQAGIAKVFRAKIPHTRSWSEHNFRKDGLYVKLMHREPGPVIPVYDLTVPVTHGFVANAVMNHNTGRASYRLHNIKKKKELLDQFVAAPGHVLVKFDSSQIEMRVLAEMSEDKALLQIFIDDADFHEETRQFLFGEKPDDAELADWQRTVAKSVNFGTAYGLDADGLYDQLCRKISNFSMSPQEVADFHRRYYQRFPQLLKWQRGMIAFAKKHGYVENLFGRRRHLNVIDKHGANQAINTPIQSSAHDVLLVQIAMLLEAYPTHHYKFIMEQHDAVYLEIPKKYLKKEMAFVQNIMNNPDTLKWLGKKLKVPIKADMKYGIALGSLEKEEAV